MCIRGGFYTCDKSGYCGILVDIIKLQYVHNGVVIFKCDWYDNTKGVRVIQPHGLVELKHQSRLASTNVFVLAY